MNVNSNWICTFWAAWKYGNSLGWSCRSCLPTPLMVSVLVPLKAFHPCPANRPDQPKAGSQVGTMELLPWVSPKTAKAKCSVLRSITWILTSFLGWEIADLRWSYASESGHGLGACDYEGLTGHYFLTVSPWVPASISNFHFCQAVLAPETPPLLQYHCLCGFTVSYATECI